MKPLMIVCTDFSPCSDVALERAAEISKRDPTRVFLIHTYDAKRLSGPTAYPPVAGEQHRYDEDSMRQLKEARHRYFGHLSDTDVQYDSVPASSPSLEICRIANETKASLIVMGSHGRTGMLRRLLGSVAEATVRHAPCSVFVVRGQASPA